MILERQIQNLIRRVIKPKVVNKEIIINPKQANLITFVTDYFYSLPADERGIIGNMLQIVTKRDFQGRSIQDAVLALNDNEMIEFQHAIEAELNIKKH